MASLTKKKCLCWPLLTVKLMVECRGTGEFAAIQEGPEGWSRDRSVNVTAREWQFTGIRQAARVPGGFHYAGGVLAIALTPVGFERSQGNPQDTLVVTDPRVSFFSSWGTSGHQKPFHPTL
jgi:hypothetical protein